MVAGAGSREHARTYAGVAKCCPLPALLSAEQAAEGTVRRRCPLPWFTHEAFLGKERAQF